MLAFFNLQPVWTSSVTTESFVITLVEVLRFIYLFFGT